MIKLHKILRLLHVAACPIVFVLFYGRSWKRGVFEVVMNDHFLVFLSVWVPFPNFLGRLRCGLY